MIKSRPNLLIIAGFDPSGGAGILADIKTCEALHCQAAAIQTANTIQTDNSFQSVKWEDASFVIEQLSSLLNRFSFDVLKVGIVQNWELLHEIIELVLAKNKETKVVLDPVLKSSTDYAFHENIEQNTFEQVLAKTFLVTPNYNEIKSIYPKLSVEETIEQLCSFTNVYLKGGHNKEKLGKDYLYTSNGKSFTLNPKLSPVFEKHGSGCVYSTAVSAYLAKGFPLLKSTYKAKRFTEKFLASDKSLIGNFRFR